MKIKYYLLFFLLSTSSVFAEEINTNNEIKNEQSQEELIKKIFREYIEKKTQEKENNEKINVENNENLKENEKYTCILINDIKGANLHEKNKFNIKEDKLLRSITLSIDNETRDVIINDGLDKPFFRMRPNVFQRDIILLERNEILETWILDTINKKALFSQIKTGEDIGNSLKSMVGNIVKFSVSNDCSLLTE